MRPSSSQGIYGHPRPASSASVRPISRLTHRPQSRLLHSNRLKLVSLCEELVRNLQGGRDQPEDEYRARVDYASRNLSPEGTLLNKASLPLDQKEVERMLWGHVQKAKIHSRDTLAEALEKAYKHLRVHVGQAHDFDQNIKPDRIPLHLQLLLALATTPAPSTLTYASTCLSNLSAPPPVPHELTWQEIVEDEPFEGEHWQGIRGLPPGFVKDQTEDYSSDSELSLWSRDSDHDNADPSSDNVPSMPCSPAYPNAGGLLDSLPDIRLSIQHRREVEDLQSRQYWRKEWRMPVETMGTRFDVGEASTLGPALLKVMGRDRARSMSLAQLGERHIYEHDAVREVLIALQGRSNIMLYLDESDKYQMTKETPRLLHLSLASQASILSSLAELCTCLYHLRQFVSRVLGAPSTSGSKTQTLEAFADAADSELRLLDTWCAEMEVKHMLASNGCLAGQDGLVISLLSLEIQLRDKFEHSFGVLLGVVRSVVGNRHLPPTSLSTTTALLLDSLFYAIQENLERGERITAGVLMRVFVRSSEPLWGMVGRWLRNGMGVGDINDLEDEFFIESNGLGSGIFGVGLLDADYWTEGYTVRYEDEEDGSRKGLPAFFRPVAEAVLASGKAVGLLKALGIAENEINWKWCSLAELVSREIAQDEASGLFGVSVDTLSSLIYEELAPYCARTGLVLSNAITDECEFWSHLGTIEDLYLMRKGDSMNHFCDTLFSKMDSQQHWSDFHFLNTTFNDAVKVGQNAGMHEWVRLSLVRLSHRGSKAKIVGRTVRNLDGLSVEYAVPFPLVYIFTPKTLQLYGEIFVFLLQIKRAKSVLESILVRRDSRKGNEMKSLYAIRSRLNWFVNVLLNFLTTYVIHAQIPKFHEALRSATSLDTIIHLHDDHLDKLHGRCLLQNKTAALHRSILSILDIAVSFGEMFVAVAGDTVTHDISRASIITQRRRTKTQRRMRKNVVGLSSSVEVGSEDSSSESELDEDGEMQEPHTSFSLVQTETSAWAEDEGRLDKMSSELDTLVKFVRRGAESLAGGTSDAAATFGVIAFTLEDWDA